MLMRLMLICAGLLAALGLGAAPAAAQSANLAAVAPVTGCATLASLDLAGVTGAPTTLAATQVDGAKPYCRVTGVIARAIHFEVRLPTAGWTQRYLQTGCGGLCGSLRITTDNAEGCTPVTDGSIVMASTDMGHQGMDGAWGDNPDQRIDFAHRGVHVTALAAKALIRAFYGQPQRYAYFSGCSDGGREALIEAQRYPADFDGIAAGAPALNFTIQNSFHHAWLAKVNTGADGHALLTAIDMPPLHAAVLKACDGLDGLVDGQITDPRACHVDPAVIQCAGAYQPGQCLTAAQVAAVRAIYAGAHTADGRALEVGPLQPGSELEWIGVFVPRDRDGTIGSAGMALGTIDHLLFTPNPAYTIADFPFTAAMFASMESARALYNADNPDLGAFAGHGGKLILYHGWADPHISPLNTIDYYERVGRRMGAVTRAGFVRLFLLPGMGHCGGGDGPSQFPLLASLMAWVEGGQAPDMVIAHRARPPVGATLGLPADMHGAPPPGAMPPPSGADHDGPPPEMLREMQRKMAAEAALPARSRPVYAYPQVAQYVGSGSIDDPANFRAVTPPPVAGIRDWIGAR